MTSSTYLDREACEIDKAFKDAALQLGMKGPLVHRTTHVTFCVSYVGVPYGIRFSIELLDNYVAPILFLARGKETVLGYYDELGRRQAYHLYEALVLLGIDETNVWNATRELATKRAPLGQIVAVMTPMIVRNWPELIAGYKRLFVTHNQVNEPFTNGH